MSEIHEAIVAALSEMPGVPKTRTAKIPTKNGGEYRYEYANIEDVIEHTRPLLAKHGLVVLQPTCETEQGMGVRTTLVHTSGDTFDAGTLAFRSTGDPQRDGGLITYYRRYALLSALGLAAEDDDGAAATDAVRNRGAEQRSGPDRAPERELFDEKAAYNHLIAVLEERQVPEHVQVAHDVWLKAKPKLTDGEISDDEWQRILSVSDEHLGAAIP